MQSDLQILKHVAERDPEALSKFYDLHAGLVYSLARRILGPGADAEIVTQEVFLSVWKRAGEYNPVRGSVKTWLLAITRSRAIDELRKSGRERLPRDPDNLAEVIRLSEAESPLSDVIQDEKRRLILQALKEIPQEQRIAIYLNYYDGLSHSQIARTLDEPLGTVKTRIQLGLEKLRKALTPYFVQEK